jgi:hypothetical protein
MVAMTKYDNFSQIEIHFSSTHKVSILAGVEKERVNSIQAVIGEHSSKHKTV